MALELHYIVRLPTGDKNEIIAGKAGFESYVSDIRLNSEILLAILIDFDRVSFCPPVRQRSISLGNANSPL